MKKIIVAAIAIILTTSLLTGCGAFIQEAISEANNQSSSAANESSPVDESSTPTSSEEEKEVGTRKTLCRLAQLLRSLNMTLLLM